MLRRFTRRPINTIFFVASCIGLAAAMLAQGRGGQAPPAAPVNQSADPLLRSFTFRSIGPANMMGRVDDIQAAEQDPLTMYVGFATGGLWKSTDGGNYWKPLWESQDNASVGAIAIAPSNKEVVYVGTGEANNRQSSSIGDGVWGTTDGGAHWTHLGLENTQSIGRIVVDPTNPNIVYVAAVGHLFGPNPERGLYKSVDGGKTWKQSKFIDNDTGFNDVAIDLAHPNVLYASSYSRRRTWWGMNGGGANSALWKTVDAGNTWTKLDGDGWPKPKDGIYGRIAMSVFRGNSNIVYAQVEAGAGAGTGGGTDKDGGPQKQVTPGSAPPPPGMTPEQIVSGFAEEKVTPEQMRGAISAGIVTAEHIRNAVNAGTLQPQSMGPLVGRGGGGAGGNGCTNGTDREWLGPAGGRGGAGGGGGAGRGGAATPPAPDPNGNGVYRSEDGGKTWKQMSGCNDRPMYFSQIRVDPNNDQKIFTGGNPGRVSVDGGKTWYGMQAAHTDFHAIWINPKDSRQVWVGHDGGFDSSNNGAKPGSWDHHNDIAVGQFYQVSADMRRPYWVCGGLQDNNAWCGPSAMRAGNGPTNADWFVVSGGDGFYTRQDPTDWAIVYGESQDGNMSRHDLRNGTQKSIRPNAGRGTVQGGEESGAAAAAAQAAEAGGFGGGRGGAPNVVNPPAKLDPLRFYWNAPIEVSPHDPAKLYMAAQYFFKSSNRGDTWWMNATDLSKNVNRWAPEQTIMGVSGEKPMASKHDGYAASSLATQIRESPSRPGVIWIGTDDGNLQLSMDDGETFTNVMGNIKPAPNAPHGWVQVSRIEPSHFDPATCYVALDNHRNDDFRPYLYKTTDYGKSWTSVTGDLPAKGNINALREDPVNPNLLFVGTEFGLYVTLKGGNQWTKFMTGLPSVRVDDILIHPRDHDLILATHGRSIWIADDITALEQYKPQSGVDVVLYEPRPVVQWKNDPFSSRNPTARDFHGQNPQGGTAVSVYSAKEVSGAKLEFLTGTTVVSTMNVDLKPGINRVQWNMQKVTANAAPAGGGRRGGRGGQGAPPPAQPTPPAEGQAPPAQQTPAQPINVQQVLTDALGGQFGFGGGGGGRGGAVTGVPFVAGGRGGGFGGGGGSTLVDPGVYMVRLTVGDKTYSSSVQVLEDHWQRVQ